MQYKQAIIIAPYVNKLLIPSNDPNLSAVLFGPVFVFLEHEINLAGSFVCLFYKGGGRGIISFTPSPNWVKEKLLKSVFITVLLRGFSSRLIF